MAKKQERVKNFLRGIINARYSVSSWLWILVSTASAIILLLLISSQPHDPDTAEFLSKLPLNGYAWTVGLTITGFVKMFGMAFHKDKAVAYGAFFAFCLWVFGFLTFIFVGNTITVILLILPIMVFNAYLFLGATLREHPQA
jgi:hypothetical protein